MHHSSDKIIRFEDLCSAIKDHAFDNFDVVSNYIGLYSSLSKYKKIVVSVCAGRAETKICVYVLISTDIPFFLQCLQWNFYSRRRPSQEHHLVQYFRVAMRGAWRVFVDFRTSFPFRPLHHTPLWQGAALLVLRATHLSVVFLSASFLCGFGTIFQYLVRRSRCMVVCSRCMVPYYDMQIN